MNKRIKKKYIKKRYRGSIMTNEAYQSLITFRNCEQCLKKGVNLPVEKIMLEDIAGT